MYRYPSPRKTAAALGLVELAELELAELEPAEFHTGIVAVAEVEVEVEIEVEAEVAAGLWSEQASSLE